METIEKTGEGTVRAECPFCSWSKEYDSVSDAGAGLRPHIQFACDEAGDEAKSQPSKYVDSEIGNLNDGSSEEDEGDYEPTEFEDELTQGSSDSKSVDWSKALKYVVPLGAALFIVNSFLEDDSSEESEEVDEESVEKSGSDDDDHQLVQ